MQLAALNSILFISTLSLVSALPRPGYSARQASGQININGVDVSCAGNCGNNFAALVGAFPNCETQENNACEVCGLDDPVDTFLACVESQCDGNPQVLQTVASFALDECQKILGDNFPAQAGLAEVAQDPNQQLGGVNSAITGSNPTTTATSGSGGSGSVISASNGSGTAATGSAAAGAAGASASASAGTGASASASASASGGITKSATSGSSKPSSSGSLSPSSTTPGVTPKSTSGGVRASHSPVGAITVGLIPLLGAVLAL